jgi:hypothetical protein
MKLALTREPSGRGRAIIAAACWIRSAGIPVIWAAVWSSAYR